MFPCFVLGEVYTCNVVPRFVICEWGSGGHELSQKCHKSKKGTDENLFWKMFELAENSKVGRYGPALDWQIGSAGVTGELELSTVETVDDGVEVVVVAVVQSYPQ